MERNCFRYRDLRDYTPSRLRRMNQFGETETTLIGLPDKSYNGEERM
jgi:hypothetical protein